MKQKINQSPRDIMQILISFIIILSVCISISGLGFYFTFPNIISSVLGLIFILNLIMLIIIFVTIYKLDYKEKYSYKNVREE